MHIYFFLSLLRFDQTFFFKTVCFLEYYFHFQDLCFASFIIFNGCSVSTFSLFFFSLFKVNINKCTSSFETVFICRLLLMVKIQSKELSIFCIVFCFFSLLHFWCFLRILLENRLNSSFNTWVETSMLYMGT